MPVCSEFIRTEGGRAHLAALSENRSTTVAKLSHSQNDVSYNLQNPSSLSMMLYFYAKTNVTFKGINVNIKDQGPALWQANLQPTNLNTCNITTVNI